MKKIQELIHRTWILPTRKEKISQGFSNIIRNFCPDIKSILDVGCGDGEIAKKTVEKTGLKIEVTGAEVKNRDTCQIPSIIFDGLTLPLKNQSVDIILLSDVIHHSLDAQKLLQECSRVARYILIKDHIQETEKEFKLLEKMDGVGNDRFSVENPHNYLTKKEWETLYKKCGLKITTIKNSFKVHPFPVNQFFPDKLHFIALLRSCNQSSDQSSS